MVQTDAISVPYFYLEIKDLYISPIFFFNNEIIFFYNFADQYVITKLELLVLQPRNIYSHLAFGKLLLHI